MDLSIGGSATQPLVSRKKVANVHRDVNKTQHDTPQVSCATEKTMSQSISK